MKAYTSAIRLTYELDFALIALEPPWQLLLEAHGN
jgi:hypothetical protein